MMKYLFLFPTLILFLFTSCDVSEDKKDKEIQLLRDQLRAKEDRLRQANNKKPETQASDPERTVLDIRRKFNAINSAMNTYLVIELSNLEESSEGGALLLYLDQDKNLVKAITTLYGTMGNVITEFYYWNEELFFVFAKETEYNMPAYMEDHEVKAVLENRYYFEREQLIKWLNPDKLSVSNINFPSQERELLQYSNVIKQRLSQTNGR